ncbi:AAA family ATPase [Pantoea ananatis]
MKELGLDVSLKGNPGMRKAVWAASAELQLTETQLPASKAKEDTKRIWEQIESWLPMFALFQSDRSSPDSDDEVQSPMKAAITAALAEVQDDIARIQLKVQQKAEEIARNTHEALKTIELGLASELTPEFTRPTPAKWQGLFSVGLNTDGGSPLNKRGSGVRRLVLVSFFKAEAERRLKSSIRRSIIYSIEEPETSQHPNYQLILIPSKRVAKLSLPHAVWALLQSYRVTAFALFPVMLKPASQQVRLALMFSASSRIRWASHQTTVSDCCSVPKDQPMSPLLRLSVKRCTQKTTLFQILRVMNV